MNWKKKVLGIPLIYLLLFGIVSGSIVGVVFVYNKFNVQTQLNVTTNTIEVLQTEDGNTTDEITFTKNGENIIITAPLYVGNDNVTYYDAIKTTILKKGLLLVNASRTNNAIERAWFYDGEYDPGTQWREIFTTPYTNATKRCDYPPCVSMLHFRIDTKPDAQIGQQDTIYFKLEFQAQ